MIDAIEVGNMRHAPKGQQFPEGWVYVGRPTDLGNPYKLPHGATEAQRAQVIGNYARWLDGMLHQPSTEAARMFDRLEQQAREGVGTMTLICWCSPLGCHADIIATRLRQRLGLPEPGQEGGRRGEPDGGPGGGGRAQG